MKNIVENQCIKTDKPLPMSYEALKAERDALAVENAALKSSVDLIASAYTECEPAGFEIDRARNIEIPSTSAALAAIEARGVEKFADDLHKTAMALCSVKPDNTTPGAYAGLARSFAAELRKAK
ncbi:hypothetical protein PTT65_17805 [Serratia ureilytica]|uniref:hypothetical protein n=1 Tax=Serratia ureilytica TaxID=300181 RepID=UPI00313D1931